MTTQDNREPELPRFRVEIVDPTGAVKQQQSTNDAGQAVDSFSKQSKEEFGRDLGRGSVLRLVDARGDYDASTHFEGFGTYRTTFANETARALHEQMSYAKEFVKVTALPSSLNDLNPQGWAQQQRLKQQQAQQRDREPTPMPKATQTVVELAAGVADNRIEFLPREQLKSNEPSIEALRREAAKSPDSPTSQPGSPSAGAATAATPPSANDQAPQPERDRTLDVIARMNQRELEQYVTAKRASPEQAEEVLKQARARQLTQEPERLAQRTAPGLEDRFNVVRNGMTTDYLYRDRPGTAFSEHLLSIKTVGDSPVVVAGMLDRAQERGWESIKLTGTAEFKRQAWIAAEARGIKAVGHQPTEADRAEAVQQRDRLAKARGDAAPSWNEIHTVTPAAKADSDRQIKAQQRQAELGAVERPSQSALRSYLVSTNQAPPDLERLVANVGSEFQSKRVHVGQLVDHGQAPYEFKKGSEPNYFVKLQTSAGEQTIWGKDLERAVSNIERGRVIALEHRGKEPVVVQVQERDGAGNVVGRKEIEATRNVWHAQTLDQLRAEPRVDKTAPQPQHLTADPAQRPRQHESSPAAPAQAPSPQRQQRPELSPAERKAEDALMREVERAFAARGVPPELRAELRQLALQSFDDRRARGEPVQILEKKAPVRDQAPMQPQAPKRKPFQQEQSR